MVAVLTCAKVEIAYGYFYELIPFLDPNPDEALYDGLTPKREWVFSAGPNTGTPHYVTNVDSKRISVDRYECALNAEHRKEALDYDYEIDLALGDYLGAFLPATGETIISKDLAKLIRESGLKGARMSAVRKIDTITLGDNRKRIEALQPLYQLSFEGKWPRQFPKIAPESADKCPFCGVGPLVCPSCGRSANPCANCGKMWGVPAGEHKGAKDARIKLEFLGVGVDLIDPRKWDGNDFIGTSSGGWITRRALDWLLSIHAAPFEARPIPVNVLGLTKEERAKLEEAKEPLPQVREKESAGK